MNHSCKGDSPSYMKRWIIQQKVNHSGICESHIWGWNVIHLFMWMIHLNHSCMNHAFHWKDSPLSHEWFTSSFMNYLFTIYFLVYDSPFHVWFTFSMNDSPFDDDSPFHLLITFSCMIHLSWMIHLFMNDSPFHEWFTF